MMLEGLSLDQNVVILMSIALMWLGGFLMTRLTKALRLPNVTGYILAGVVMGPYMLNLIPAGVIAGMDFITDAALGFIAFGVGRYLRLDALKRNGAKVIVLTLFEALAAGAAVTLSMMLIFKLPLDFSLLLGAIASATAPASSLMTIRQYHAKGEFVRTLVQVVAMDDVVSLLAFSVCSAVVMGGGDMQSVLHPLINNLLALAVAMGLGWLLARLVNDRRSREHALVLSCSAIFALAAFSGWLQVSPLLGSMVMGMVYANMHEEKSLFKTVHRFTPPIMMLFFALSGMRLDLASLTTAGIIGVAYFIIRIVGKFAGAWLGARVTGASDGVRKYLGLALIPQAGVSIGLAVLGQRLLPESYGALLSTIILSSSVLYEMIGPVSAKQALVLSGAIKTDALPMSKKKSEERGSKPTQPSNNRKSPENKKASKNKGDAPAVNEKKPAETGKEKKLKYSPGSQRMYPMRREKQPRG